MGEQLALDLDLLGPPPLPPGRHSRRRSSPKRRLPMLCMLDVVPGLGRTPLQRCADAGRRVRTVPVPAALL
jgi:hypothetical protein